MLDNGGYGNLGERDTNLAERDRGRVLERPAP